MSYVAAAAAAVQVHATVCSSIPSRSCHLSVVQHCEDQARLFEAVGGVQEAGPGTTQGHRQLEDCVDSTGGIV